MSAADTLNGLKQSVSSYWSQRNKRERRMLAAAAAVMLAALFYLLLIDPALSGRERLEKQLPAKRQQAAELQAMAKETAALADTATGSSAAPPLTRDSLQASLTRQGLTPQSVSMSGDLARVELGSASFSGLVGWLDEMQKTARVSVVEANFDALAERDMVSAKLTLRQQKGEQAQ